MCRLRQLDTLNFHISLNVCIVPDTLLSTYILLIHSKNYVGQVQLFPLHKMRNPSSE